MLTSRILAKMSALDRPHKRPHVSGLQQASGLPKEKSCPDGPHQASGPVPTASREGRRAGGGGLCPGLPASVRMIQQGFGR